MVTSLQSGYTVEMNAMLFRFGDTMKAPRPVAILVICCATPPEIRSDT